MSGFKWVPKCSGSQAVITDPKEIDPLGLTLCPKCGDPVKVITQKGPSWRIPNHGNWTKFKAKKP